MEEGAHVMTDPAAIDLEAIKANSFITKGSLAKAIDDLIAAVEALRERVAWLERRHSAEVEVGVKERIEAEATRDHTETAEAHATELARVLEPLAIRYWENITNFTKAHGLSITVEMLKPEHPYLKVEAALAATPTEALERARAKDEVVKAANYYMNNGGFVGGKRFRHALSKLDALDQGDGT